MFSYRKTWNSIDSIDVGNMPSRIPSCQHLCSCALFTHYPLDIHRMFIKCQHTSIKHSLDFHWILTKTTYPMTIQCIFIECPVNIQCKINGYKYPLIFHWMLIGYSMNMHWTVMKYALNIGNISIKYSLNSNMFTLIIN